jgi:hypothetical protein
VLKGEVGYGPTENTLIRAFFLFDVLADFVPSNVAHLKLLKLIHYKAVISFANAR